MRSIGNIVMVILIVEDELLVGEYLNTVLTDFGYEVIAAADADEATAILESRDDIRIMITDVNMPGSMDGLKLARAVRGRWPPVKIIATSGRLHLDEADVPEGGRFLPKPYSPSQVTGVLRELIMR